MWCPHQRSGLTRSRAGPPWHRSRGPSRPPWTADRLRWRSTGPSGARSRRTWSRSRVAAESPDTGRGPRARLAALRAVRESRAPFHRSSWRPDTAAGPSPAENPADDLALQRDELANAGVGQGEQRIEGVAAERVRFGRALQLDEAAVAGLHDVHVDVGARVFLVGQVQHRHAADDADARGRHVVLHRNALDLATLAHALQRQYERNEASRDGGSPRPAVGLDDIAVDPDGPLAQLIEPGHRSERPADEALDLLRAPADLASRRLARGARVRRAREHAVFGRNPALAAVAPEGGHATFDARGADHVGATRGDEHRTFGVREVVRRDHNRSELVGQSGVSSHGVECWCSCQLSRSTMSLGARMFGL